MFKHLIKSIFILILILGISIFFLTLSKPPLLNDLDFSTAVYDDHHQLLRLTTTNDEQYRLFISLKQIPDNVIQATLLKEDRHFYRHFGINPFSLLRAIWQTYVLRKHRIGASTITMQVARLRYQMNSHIFLGKIKQIIYALRLERHYSKEKILEAYFNLAPYGNNIEGIAAASLIYFHRDVNDLKLPQFLALTVIPQNPLARTPRDLVRLNKARWQLFQKWYRLYPQDKTYIPLFKLPLSLYTRDQLPFVAPHFVDYVLQQHPRDSTINTTLDINLQKIIERATQHYLQNKKNQGLHNAAILLVDSEDLSVKALLGSANFFDASLQGQVNGTLAFRSPGSSLKPFIYALALEQGLIHPATVLKDVPMHFASYDPENFDYRFLGPLKAQEALILSRNIPAIYLASRLKNPSFYEFLEQLGMVRKTELEYGLSIVTGGSEIQMTELVSLYAMLLNLGVYHELRFWKSAPFDEGLRLLSKEASFVTLKMLQENPRPNQFFQKAETLKIAWKTGTSSRFRDAWTVGTFGKYVLAVWIGDFSGRGNPAFTGQGAAAPLFFSIADQIIANKALRESNEDLSSLHLTRIKVCNASGLLPTRYCPGTYETWFIPGKSPIQKDNIYREVLIDDKTGLRACHVTPHTHFKIYEFWSSDLLTLFRQAGIARGTPPPYLPECQFNDKQIGVVPTITSPRQAFNYVVSSTNKTTVIPLQAITDADVHTLYWFANDAFIGKTTPDKPLLWHATSGQFVIRIVDDLGRADAVDIKVVNVGR